MKKKYYVLLLLAALTMGCINYSITVDVPKNVNATEVLMNGSVAMSLEVSPRTVVHFSGTTGVTGIYVLEKVPGNDGEYYRVLKSVAAPEREGPDIWDYYWEAPPSKGEVVMVFATVSGEIEGLLPAAQLDALLKQKKVVIVTVK